MMQDISFDGVFNRNEKRVQELLPALLAQYPQFNLEDIDIQDIYALALNKLPARYVQRMSIVLRDPITDEQVRAAICEAIDRVGQNSRLSEG
jgi:hypothetical protein